MLNRFVLSLLLVCAAAAPSLCANDMFLRLNPDVKGYVSGDKVHDDWIAVISIEDIGKTGHAGPIVIGKKTDAATPYLEKACAAGTHYTEARIEVCKPGSSQRYFMITLFNVVITQIKQNIIKTEDAGTVAEELTCTYDRIEWKYSGSKPDGSSLPEIKTEWANPSTGKQ